MFRPSEWQIPWNTFESQRRQLWEACLRRFLLYCKIKAPHQTVLLPSLQDDQSFSLCPLRIITSPGIMIGLTCWPRTNTAILYSFNVAQPDLINSYPLFSDSRLWRHWHLRLRLNGFGKGMQWLRRRHLHIAAEGVYPILISSFAPTYWKAEPLIIISNIYDRIKIISLVIMYSGSTWFLTCEKRQTGPKYGMTFQNAPGVFHLFLSHSQMPSKRKRDFM